MKTRGGPHECWLLVFPKLDHSKFETILTVRFSSGKLISLCLSFFNEPYIIGKSQSSYTMHLTWLNQTPGGISAHVNLGLEKSPLRMLLPHRSLLPELGVRTYCLKQYTSPLYRKIAFTSSYLILYRCLLLHSCQYLQNIQLSKYLSGTYITDTRKR